MLRAGDKEMLRAGDKEMLRAGDKEMQITVSKVTTSSDGTCIC